MSQNKKEKSCGILPANIGGWIGFILGGIAYGLFVKSCGMQFNRGVMIAFNGKRSLLPNGYPFFKTVPHCSPTRSPRSLW